MRPEYNAAVPEAVRIPVSGVDDARNVVVSLLSAGFIHACDRFELPDGSRKLELKRSNVITEDSYYVWRFQPPSPYRTLIAGGIVAAVLAIVMFPLWPYTLRLAVSYVATAVLVVLLAFLGFIVTVRPLFFYITKFIVPPGIWILPNINEDIGFVESFIPLWDWDTPAPPVGAKKSSPKLEKADEKEPVATSAAAASASASPDSPIHKRE